MRQLCFFILLSVILFSAQACSSGQQKATAPASAVQQEEVIPNRKLSVEIEGMVCEKGCGASIRKALKATGGVSSCSFDFSEERKHNTAVIEFDKDKVTADKLIDIITTINEKQFSVTRSSSDQLEMKVNAKETDISSEPSGESSTINVSHSSFEMPNFLKLFSRLLSGN